MRILLPPSEAKRPGGRRGRSPFEDETLGAARSAVLDALRALGSDPAQAARVLALPARTAAEDLATNSRLAGSPLLPALRRYSGVVYDGLDAATLSAPAARRAGAAVLVFSGLLGVSRGRDPVPLYRVPAGAALPGLGPLTAYWRPVLAAALPPLLGSGLVVDLRSSDYAAMWRPDGRTVRVRVLSRRPDGSLAVVSHPSKFGKGRLARALLERPARTADDVLAAWARLGGCDGTRRGDTGLDLVL